jgi:hypothetical protein
MKHRVKDALFNRRDLLTVGGAALLSRYIDMTVWPLKVQAAGNADPVGTARNCIFIELAGAPSQYDLWDFKEHSETPGDLDVRKVTSDLYLSNTLFPQLSAHAHRLSMVRTIFGRESEHGGGQYHTQTGRSLQPAIAKEIPAFGSIIAYELESQRKEADTFPTYVSSNLAGAIGSGFLPARYTGMDLDPQTAFEAFESTEDGARQTALMLQKRWELVTALRDVSEGERASLSEKTAEYSEYYSQANRIINDTRWTQVFRSSDAEKKKYGNGKFGLGCIIAKNLLAANAGTRFVYVRDAGQWDNHTRIFDRTNPTSHYGNAEQLDKGLANLLTDLNAMPGTVAGKTMLDETLVVVTSEFGRVPQYNPSRGKDHNHLFSTLFFGGGTKAGRLIGKTTLAPYENKGGEYKVSSSIAKDAAQQEVLDVGWKHKKLPRKDNVIATVYSALGIDWLKKIDNTPSGRAYEYVERFPLGDAEPIDNDAFSELWA